MQRRTGSGITALFAGILILFCSSAFGEPNMQEGKWDIKGEMKIEGLPFPMPAVPVNYSSCITKKDMVPQQKEKNQDCTPPSTKLQGNTVLWTVTCKDKHGAVTESSGSITYNGTSFNGSVKNVTTDAKGAKSTSNLKMSGKRTGDCSK